MVNKRFSKVALVEVCAVGVLSFSLRYAELSVKDKPIVCCYNFKSSSQTSIKFGIGFSDEWITKLFKTTSKN